MTTQELREAIKRNTVAIKIVSKDASGSGSVKEHDHYEYLLHENFEKDILSLIAKHEAELVGTIISELKQIRESEKTKQAHIDLDKYIERLSALTDKESKE